MGEKAAYSGSLTNGPIVPVYSPWPATSVKVNGSPLLLVDSVIPCHNHGNNLVCFSPFKSGSKKVRAEGKYILRVGDSADCGHSLTTGSENVRIT